MQIYAITTVTSNEALVDIVTEDEVEAQFLALTEGNEDDREMSSGCPTGWYMEDPNYMVYVSDPNISKGAAQAIANNLTLDQTIKEWYATAYPKDDMTDELCSLATFGGLNANLPDAYDYIGNNVDSVIRERVFAELSSRLGVPYSEIYDRWLGQ